MTKYILHAFLFLLPTLAIVILGINIVGLITGIILSIIWVIIGVALTARDGIKNR